MRISASVLITVLAVPLAASAQALEVQARSGLNVRKGPGLQHRVLTVAPNAAILLGAGETQGTWARISYKDVSGWVHTDYVEEVIPFDPDKVAELAPETQVVTAGRLNFRDGPGTNHSSFGLLNRGTKVEVIGKHGKWRKVKVNGQTAWVHADYLGQPGSVSSGGGSVAASYTPSGSSSSGGNTPPHVVPIPGHPRGKMIPGAADALARMIAAARADGITLGFSDTYRNPDLQERAYQNWLRTGLNLAGNKVPSIAPGYGPRASYHTRGRAVDLTNGRGSVMHNTKEHAWLLQNAGRFGFTGIRSEAWHWNWKQ